KSFSRPLSKFFLHGCTDAVTLNREPCNLASLYFLPNLVVVHLHGHQPSAFLNYDCLISNSEREVLRCLIVLNQLQVAVVVLMHVADSAEPFHEAEHCLPNLFFGYDVTLQVLFVRLQNYASNDSLFLI